MSEVWIEIPLRNFLVEISTWKAFILLITFHVFFSLLHPLLIVGNAWCHFSLSRKKQGESKNDKKNFSNKVPNRRKLQAHLMKSFMFGVKAEQKKTQVSTKPDGIISFFLFRGSLLLPRREQN